MVSSIDLGFSQREWSGRLMTKGSNVGADCVT